MVMTAIYSQLEKLYQQHYSSIKSSILFKKESIPISTKTRVTHELVSSRYISLERTRLETILQHTSEYNTWSSPHFHIHIWNIPGIGPGMGTSMDWDMIIKRVLIRLELLYTYYGHTVDSKIIFTCIPFDEKRILPSSLHTCVKPEHINGGYTYVGKNEVYIFRKEECPKVILHEYLHQVQGNYDIQWSSNLLEQMYRTWNISMDGCDYGMDACSTLLRPNEAIIELWAWIYQSVFVSMEYGIPIHEIWNAELEFTWHQVGILIAHQEACSPHSNKWTEDTHAFSYYVLKGFFAWQSYIFKDHADKHRNIPDLFYKPLEIWQQVQSNWDSYWTFIKTKTLIKKPSKTSSGKKSKEVSMRMTLFGDF